MNNKPYVILVGIDFSELADRALEEALVLASKRPDAEVHAVAIVPVPTLDARFALPAYALIDEASSLVTAGERLRSHLEALRPSLRRQAPRVVLAAAARVAREHQHASAGHPRRS